MSTPETPESTDLPPEVGSPAPAAPPAPDEQQQVVEVRAEEATEAESDEGEGEGEGEGVTEAVGEGASATPNAAPGTGKKRRRRRRKKKPGAAQATDASASGATGEPTDPAQASPEGEPANGTTTDAKPVSGERPREGRDGKKKDRRPKNDRPPREPRERPAFALGDVVFGKIVDVTFHCLFVDLSGKAIGIFDRRELEIPDELPPMMEEEEEEEEKQPEPAPEPAPAAALPDAPADAPAEGENAPAAPVEIVEAAKPKETTPPPKKKAPQPSQQLPPVICETGAHFVGVVHNDGSRGGLVVLTRHPRRASRAKPMVANAFRERKEVSGLVTGTIKGGIEVDVDGLRAFAPGSHMDLKLGADLKHLIGKRLSFVVTQYAKKGRDLVLSRRAMLEAEATAHREEVLGKIEVGSVVDGVVKSVVPFGAFVDIGGVEGLVPLAEMSHNRSDSPSDVFKVGETTKVKILRVDEKRKIWLSHRATIVDPWQEVVKKYAPQSRHTGKIVRLQPFGVFVELESGIDGLIHSSDLSIKRFDHPSEIVNVGDAIEVVVASVDSGAHKIALHPVPAGASADEPKQKVAPHKPVKVIVVAIDAGGLIVRILGVTGRNARGFITSAATGTARGTELRKFFPVGKELEAKVMEIDPRRGEVKLSIKSLSEENERSAYRQYREQVTREAKFGTFGDLLAKKLQK